MAGPIHRARPSEVRALPPQLDFHPSRILGQNFLVDRNVFDVRRDAGDILRRIRS